jgi:hypothetical protein
LRIRGRLSEGRFIARTIWPDDYALDFEHLAYQPLAAGETLETLVRADGGQPSAPLAARVLWQRDAAAQRHWAGRPVLAFMLNGAQGDDDEAHGGHFASATGAFGDQGQWGDWVVNNFYNLDSISEKGIIASMLSMDDYMADLNSGQSWYRPSFMLVAVLKQKRVASRFQEAVARVYNHFYRHDFSYRHASANCAGVNVETLRSLGWKIPEQGPTSRLQAVAGLPYMAIKDLSLDSGLKAYDYLVAERTDLYPFVAFEAIGRDLLQRLAAGGAGASAYERMLAQDIEALIYVRIPQFPSSRAMGQAPIASIDEYLGRVPQDKSKWKIVPVPPRPFPKGCQAPRRWRVPNRMPRNHQPITGSNVAEEAGSSQHRFKTSPKPLLPQHFRNSKIGTVLHARLPSFLAGGRRPFVIPFPYQNTNTVGTVGTLCFFRSPTISWGNRS